MPSEERVRTRHRLAMGELDGVIGMMGDVHDDLVPTYVRVATRWKSIHHDMGRMMELIT